MTTARFTNPLSITSQFAFCSLPLRLDSYRGCAFACAYCFATQRGGASRVPQIGRADPEVLQKVFERADREGPESESPLIQMIARRVPIHFGGMSDPFQPAEKKWRVSLDMLRILKAWRYPVVISTKSAMVADQEYIQLLSSLESLVIQFSMSTTKDLLAKEVEPLSSAPSLLLRCMEMLSRAGINVLSRWQPYIPGLSETPDQFLTAVASVGAKHVSFEHLKIPLERGQANPAIMSARSTYLASSARRDGREYVLRAEDKLPVVTEVKKACHRHKLTFGAGDNELLYLSDTEGCCSGVDQFDGFENVFKYTIACAVRRGVGYKVSYDRISKEWRPTGSIDRYLNSRSRLGRRLSVSGTVEDHIKYKWNSATANGGPTSYFGVQREPQEQNGMYAIYSWSSNSSSAMPKSCSRTSLENGSE